MDDDGSSLVFCTKDDDDDWELSEPIHPPRHQKSTRYIYIYIYIQNPSDRPLKHTQSSHSPCALLRCIGGGGGGGSCMDVLVVGGGGCIDVLVVGGVLMY